MGKGDGPEVDGILLQEDGPSCSFFLDTSKGIEINLLLLEGELHTCQFHPQKQYIKKAWDGPRKRSDRKGTETDVVIAGWICLWA